MKYPLSHISAALYWTAYGAPHVPNVADTQTQRLAPCTVAFAFDASQDTGGLGRKHMLEKRDASAKNRRSSGTFDWKHALEKAAKLDALDRNGCLHILSTSIEERIWNHGIVCHCCSHPLPARCFVAIEGGGTVVSPDLSFVQMGTELSVPQLARYGMILCGIHAVTPSSILSEEGAAVPLPRRKCVTSVDRLERAVEEFSFLKGARRAKAATRHIAERSRSPMETAAALLLSLPYRMGGYNMPLPRMNQVLRSTNTVSAPNGLIADGGGRAFEYDLVFERGRRIAVVEYAGLDYHRDEFSLYRDSIRSNAANSANVLQLDLTKRQLYNEEAFHLLALQLGRHLGIRFRPTSHDFAQRVRALRRDILKSPWGAMK